MHVDLVALPRGDAPISRSERAASRSIDRITVFRKPSADGTQSRLEFLGDFSVWHWADVKKQIGIVACGTNEHFFHFFWRLVLCVADIEPPRTVERVATFQRKRVADVCGVEAGGVAAGKIAFESLHVFAGFRRLMMVRNDERRGL